MKIINYLFMFALLGLSQLAQATEIIYPPKGIMTVEFNDWSYQTRFFSAQKGGIYLFKDKTINTLFECSQSQETLRYKGDIYQINLIQNKLSCEDFENLLKSASEACPVTISFNTLQKVIDRVHFSCQK